MAFRIDSSLSPTNIYVGVTTVSVLAICAFLFARTRGKIAATPTAPALNQGRVSPWASVPVIGHVYNYFCPTKKAVPIQISIGSKKSPITSMDELNQAFILELQKHASGSIPMFSSAVIYGDNLDITHSTAISTLHPTKLILSGARIVDDATLHKPLLTELKTQGYKTCEVSTVEEALKDVVTFNPAKAQANPVIYIVKP
ncbi:MAG TPA: hypothetical protein VHK67_01085 [Rhabdochlamydiaceae bacterium]|jgi:hypothetical protein|nr:hypothetical protein [Rhabdochlamydiaceae bacterium]